MSLVDKQAQFAIHVALLILQARNLGFQVTFGEAYRPPETAQIYARDGRGIPNSLHTKRLAIDLNLFHGGIYLTQTEDYQKLGEYWKNLHPENRWGGDFQSRADANHFSREHEGVK